jgi:hypothetical protein
MDCKISKSINFLETVTHYFHMVGLQSECDSQSFSNLLVSRSPFVRKPSPNTAA